MNKISHILVPTDFSDCSHRARDYACDLIDLFHAELHLLHVIHDFAVEIPEFGMGLSFPGYLEGVPEKKRELAAAAQEHLAIELDPVFKENHHVTFSVRFGPPMVEILHYARENEIDLIVMGTHGRTGLPHAVLGSVAERVIQRSTCPVLTVPMSKHP